MGRYFLILFIGLLGISACSPKAETVKPQADIFFISPDLATDAKRFTRYIESDLFEPVDCEPFLNQTWRELFTIPASYFDRNRSPEDALAIYKLLFEARIALGKKLSKFYEQGNLDRKCADAWREMVRTGRFMEDYVGDWLLREAGIAPTTPILRGMAPNLMVNPKFKFVDPVKDLRSGDVIITRYHAFSSATFARIGDIAGQFSHSGLVYVREDGKVFTIESFVESGVVVRPWETGHLKDGNIREAVYRFRDSKMAKRAAQLAFSYIWEMEKRGERIPYDYEMNLEDTRKMYCAEVIHQAYRFASADSLKVPLFETILPRKNPAFLDSLNIRVKSTFAPSDMEVDPRFELVAEWRDFQALSDVHLKDVVLTKIFDWMQDRSYKIQFDLYTYVMTNMVLWLRHVGFFSSQVATDTPRVFVEGIQILQAGAAVLNEKLKVRADSYRSETGLMMTPYQMYNVLEDIRVKDLELYNLQHSMSSEEVDPSPLFHDIIRP
jgi:hypothetical protein